MDSGCTSLTSGLACSRAMRRLVRLDSACSSVRPQRYSSMEVRPVSEDRGLRWSHLHLAALGRSGLQAGLLLGSWASCVQHWRSSPDTGLGHWQVKTA